MKQNTPELTKLQQNCAQEALRAFPEMTIRLTISSLNRKDKINLISLRKRQLTFALSLFRYLRHYPDYHRPQMPHFAVCGARQSFHNSKVTKLQHPRLDLDWCSHSKRLAHSWLDPFSCFLFLLLRKFKAVRCFLDQSDGPCNRFLIAQYHSDRLNLE